MRGSISAAGPGRWRVRYDAGEHQDGRRKQSGFYVHGPKKKAQAELTRVLHEIQTGEFVDANRMTVGQYLDKWLADYARPKVSPKTYERYAEIVRKHLVPAFGAVRLAQLRPLQIQSYYTEAQEHGRRDGRGGLSAQTVVHHHRILKQALQQAIRWQLLVRNPAEGAQPPAPEEREMQILTPEETADLFRRIENHRYFVPLLLHVTTGLRRGEVLALRWSDVDLALGRVTVRQSLEETKEFGLRFKQPKTKKSRRPLPIPSLLIEALVRHKGEQAQAKLLYPGWADGDLVFSDPTGAPIPPSVVTKAFSYLRQKHPDLKRIRLHDLRHTHATHLLLEGVHPKVVSERMGHANIGITLDTYSHVIPGMQEDAAKQIDASLRAAMGKPKRALEGAQFGVS